MSKLLDRFRYFKQKGEIFADGHGQVMHSNRDWEDSYRQRWQFDKIVRSTHGVNCTGSCSWKIYVKNGLVTWEIQQTDYPRTRPDLPNHEPRGCPRGASYSWYLYSANRLKYPLIRKRLIELWREALKQHSDPVLAWASIMNDPQKCLSYKQVRGRGGFIRSNWQELNQLIAAANVWTIKTYGPDRVAGFSPIPAMSMVSYAAGTRYLSLLGGTCLSFYDWYCDLPPASPMTWGEQITGVPRQYIETIAREFADTAHKTHGRSMIILGAGVNHWYHMDMNYRGMINMLIFCGCVGQSGGGWAHYVGQEKLRPQTGWLPLAFAFDWNRPPRQMNSTSFFYNHSSQWRYEKVTAQELLSPLADASKYSGHLIDFNVRAERMGWLPSAPQLGRNPLSLKAEADKAGLSPTEFTAQALKSGDLRMACEQPDSGSNHPRNLFVWRSNLLGSSGKGHEYMQKYLLGTESGIQGEELGASDGIKPEEVEWQTAAIEGKLDLLVTLDFRMSSTCLFSDIVLPTATWYEKDDMNTSDMHPFIHPLSAAVDPAWESRSDWEIYKGIAKAFSQVCVGHLGKETDVVLQPLLHDSPAELSQPCEVLDWRKGECDLIPGKTAPNIVAVERDYPATYERFTSLGPLMDKLGNGGKGISWNTQDEIDFLGKLNYTKRDGPAQGRPLIDTAIDASEVILALAPETNGHVAVKAWQALGEITGREHTHLALHKEDEKIRFRDIQAQPRKIISSPTWSGLESDHVSYNAGYTNVHELIPWRTLSGRQQLYQDHPWMRAFGESLVAYRPPIDTRSVSEMRQIPPNGFPEKALNFLTPHQKWGIHSTYSENLLMLTLSRGGPIVWISETDARELTIVDNDWVEVFNANGALTARAVVSQRVPPGMTMMYHAQERIMNIPGSEVTGMRGGIHNSVTRVCPKPTHMIGGYAQLAWGFNYYGTVGSNRDEFIMIRKMKNVNWLDDEGRDQVQEAKK
ncbi:TPA: nitrate reductase subunit alpha [Escherichia coli]|nr:nitrate reductase subunit alpha [Escherichia coli]KAA1929368.1 nitrate reductase subunit alpha [Escherichia coli]HAK9287678.1 nitrate reductase subunit alpha [Escherichia coli]HAX0267627.1 nitrate reductase subunit alpha [Escherichia coli JJ1901]HDT1760774.1 nitrate reductase subunit alpha [Escherichia coli]